MERLTSVQGRAIPLLVPDIDTDVITPIKRVMQGGDALTRYAFESLRYKADGTPDPECPLNQEAYREAPILLAGANFACGSSRETAVCDPTGEAWDAGNLFVVDGSALPTGLGVNPMVTIEAAAHKIARGMAAKLT